MGLPSSSVFCPSVRQWWTPNEAGELFLHCLRETNRSALEINKNGGGKRKRFLRPLYRVSQLIQIKSHMRQIPTHREVLSSYNATIIDRPINYGPRIEREIISGFWAKETELEFMKKQYYIFYDKLYYQCYHMLTTGLNRSMMQPQWRRSQYY